MNSDYKHHNHFQRIAPLYRNLRVTDSEPIAYIARQLKSLPLIKAADIGCGTGRYTQLLLQHLGDKVSFIHCIDQSMGMLEQLKLDFAKHGFQAAGTISSSAMHLPIRTESLNCMFTFNAIHHFAMLEFLRETARILQDGGYLFAYTRLRSQNSRNIWGRFFHLFTSKETRLYEEDELKDAITKIPSLRLRKMQVFKFKRKGDLENLIKQAKNKHYSTLDLYSRSEFKTALKQFHGNLLDYFDNPHDIQWVDENVLLVLQKAS